MSQENQRQEGDLLQDQCELQTKRIVDVVPGDGHPSFLSLSCGISVSRRGDMADLPSMEAVWSDDSSTTHLSVPVYKDFNTGVVTNVPPESSLLDEVHVQGIDAGFLARHTEDRDLW